MYYIFSDVHGCYSEMEEALMKWNSDNEQLIILGDLIDRGPKSYQCIKRAMTLQKEHGAIILKGNHEEMFTTWLKNEKLAHYYYYSDAENTVNSFLKELKADNSQYVELNEAAKLINENFRDEVKFMNDLPLIHETKNALFVHAGIDFDKQEWIMGGSDDFLWIRNPFIWSEKNIGKTIYFGHTPTRTIHEDQSNDIWISPDGLKVGIDGACVFNGQLNALRVNGAGEVTETFTYPQTKIKKDL